MERDADTAEGLAELGRASTDTLGAAGFHMEAQGLWTKTGLSQD